MLAEKYATSDPEHIFMLRQLDKFMCGLARCFQFKKESEIGNTAIKTYVSEKKRYRQHGHLINMQKMMYILRR